MAGVVKEQSAQLAGVAKERVQQWGADVEEDHDFFLDLDAAKAAAKSDQALSKPSRDSSPRRSLTLTVWSPVVPTMYQLKTATTQTLAGHCGFNT